MKKFINFIIVAAVFVVSIGAVGKLIEKKYSRSYFTIR